MTFVLGLTGEKIGSRYLAKANYNDVQTALAKGGKVLNRYNCTGCHVLEMPKFSLPEGTKVADAFTDFKANVKSSYTARNNDYLAELYPGLTYDPKKKLDADNIESELGLRQDDGKPVTIEGMPIGLFENELTVQLWKPVTIRGYTFNVGDNVTLDQTKVQKTPAVGGNFAWLYCDDLAGAYRHQLRVVLEPPASPPGPRGKQGADPVVCPFPAGPLRDPAGRAAPDAAIPLWQGHRHVPPTKRKTWPTTSRPATGPSSPTRRFPSSRWATSPTATRFIPTTWVPAGR